MYFFHDECDFADDDQYDFFTLAIHIERRHNRSPRHAPTKCRHGAPVESENRNPPETGSAGGAPRDGTMRPSQTKN